MRRHTELLQERKQSGLEHIEGERFTWGLPRRLARWHIFDGLRSRTAPSPAAMCSPADAGEYRLLYEYLRDRFSDRLVLTFGQIEDLLGFPLPGAARVEREWWTNTHSVADRSKQSEAWMLAGRTASVNLPAQHVTFERET